MHRLVLLQPGPSTSVVLFPKAPLSRLVLGDVVAGSSAAHPSIATP